jgi:hypothetical protein
VSGPEDGGVAKALRGSMAAVGCARRSRRPVAANSSGRIERLAACPLGVWSCLCWCLDGGLGTAASATPPEGLTGGLGGGSQRDCTAMEEVELGCRGGCRGGRMADRRWLWC